MRLYRSLRLVSIEGGDRIWGGVRKEGGAVDVGGDGVRRDLLAPRVFRNCDALSGDVEA